MRFFYLLGVLLVCNTTFAARDFAIKAVAHANGALMASPPLPSLFSPKGRNELSLRPAMFEASNEENRGNDPKLVDYSGYGGALLLNHQSSNRFGLFFLAMGNQVTGEFSGPGEITTDSDYTIFANDVKSSLLQVSAGASFSVMKGSIIELQLFTAPSFTKTLVEQTIIQNEPTDPDDFDMILDPAILTYFAGAQVGIRISRYFTLNPYFIMTGLLNSEDSCQSYTTTVRIPGNLFDAPDENCQSGLTEYDPTFNAFGVNILFPTLGLGINAFAETGEIPLFEAVEIDMYYFTLSFNI